MQLRLNHCAVRSNPPMHLSMDARRWATVYTGHHGVALRNGEKDTASSKEKRMTTISGNQLSTKPKLLPTKPGATFLLGDLNEFTNNRLTYLQTIAEQYSPFVVVCFGPVKQVAITCPELAQQVLQANSRNYRKEQLFMKFTRLALTSGDNLFTSDGDDWLKQRRIITLPATPRAGSTGRNGGCLCPTVQAWIVDATTGAGIIINTINPASVRCRVCTV